MCIQSSLARRSQLDDQAERSVSGCFHSQLEGLVELGRPAVVLGLGGELALLVGQEGADHADLHEGPEHPRRLPLHVVDGDDCTEEGGGAGEGINDL